MPKKYLFVLGIIVFAALIAAVLYFTHRRANQPPANQNQATASPSPSVAIPTPSAPQSLGGQIYQNASNPLANKLPDANPAKNANPIQGLNVNPF